MSVSSYAQSRLSVVPPLDARAAEAQRCESEALAVIESAVGGSHKAASLHSRQYFELQLSGERGMRLADVFVWAQAVDAEARHRLAEMIETAGVMAPSQAVLLEIAEATEATGHALSFVQRVIGGGGCSPRDIQEVNARFHRAARELADVPVALRARP